ncbi:hypothetical protein H9L39_09551 [Fusarium oxysporum f. sp. albedinis]|nr:hypothetical protein H9L39_09551 [Fusarium oxysporum f. sp. albedinis]
MAVGRVGKKAHTCIFADEMTNFGIETNLRMDDETIERAPSELLESSTSRYWISRKSSQEDYLAE